MKAVSESRERTSHLHDAPPLVPILPCLAYPYMKRGRHPTNHGGDREQVGLAKTMQGGG